MTGLQRIVPWLILALLTVVAAGGAVLGVVQSPTQVGLKRAVSDTLAAPDYTSRLTTTGPTPQSQSLVYQAPNRIGGYVDVAKRRVYVAVINGFEYQSAQVPATRSPAGLAFSKRAAQSAKTYDPVQGYLPYAAKATGVKRNGDVYDFTVTQQGQVAKFAVTVSGRFVSQMTISLANTTVKLAVSAVGSSPAVSLPAGAKVTTAPAASGG